MDKYTIKGIISNTLLSIDLYSESAVQLLMGTSAHESLGWQYRRQLGNGPALGLFQMEPYTHDDCWVNYLNYNPVLSQKILSVSGMFSPNAGALETNDVYAACMARIKYLRDPQPIPDSLYGQAEYWKRVYNTYMGKGIVQEYINHYQMFVA
jgi:hypothetical protein